jgi:predicted nucleic acid-binding protein
MNGFALDSNIASFHVKGNKIVRRNVEHYIDADTKVYIPPFAYYEVMRGLKAAKATKQLNNFEEVLQRCPLGKTNDAVFETAADIHIELRRKGRLCDDMDILIAAFCKVYGLTLVTNNTKHFENISGLSLADWSIEQ